MKTIWRQEKRQRKARRREMVPGKRLWGAGLTGLRALGKEDQSVKTQIFLFKTLLPLVFSKR